MLSVPTLCAAALVLLLQEHPASLDLQRLENYSPGWTAPQPDARLDAQARADFGGRGVPLAARFLRHTGPRPSNDAFFFVLRAVGDADTALVLIQALRDPPVRESGALDRHAGEIAAAVEAVLAGDPARCDARVVLALGSAVSAARGRPHGTGRHDAIESVRLLGMCRNDEAVRALAGLTDDPDAEIRAAAAAGLGRIDPSRTAREAAAGGELVSPAQHLLQVLASDPDPTVRRQAADSLGSVEAPGINEALHAALDHERDPRVVDGLVQALRRRGRPVRDPHRCGDLAGRAWEAPVVRQLLDCWLGADAPRAALVQAAIEGPPTRRAAGLSALTQPDAERPLASLVRGRTERSTYLDPELRDRLLDSAVQVLSEDQDLSASSRESAELALWHLSERSMARAIGYADRVSPYIARVRVSGTLARADAAGYVVNRRRQQAGIAFVLALAVGLIAAWSPRLRRPMLLLAMSAAGWGLWTFGAGSVRELPPPPRQLLTVSALGWLSAGAAAAATASMRRARTLSSWLLTATLTATLAAAVAGTLCLLTRANGLLPSDLAGWEMILDPLAAALLAAASVVILLILDSVLLARLPRPDGPATHPAGSR